MSENVEDEKPCTEREDFRLKQANRAGNFQKLLEKRKRLTSGRVKNVIKRSKGTEDAR